MSNDDMEARRDPKVRADIERFALELVCSLPLGPNAGDCVTPIADAMEHWQHLGLAAGMDAKDVAYAERTRLVAWLARCFPSGIAKTEIPGWDPEWHNCVYIDLPTGQASWHYHDREHGLFIGLPPYTKPWDGHTTEQKYQRLAALWDGFASHQLGYRVTLGKERIATLIEAEKIARDRIGARAGDDSYVHGYNDAAEAIADELDCLALLANAPAPKRRGG